MKIRIAALIVLTTILFQACKTDFDINAPWKESAIVYGILNQNDTIHYIKVNKAFLGQGNALLMAQNPDSSSYGDKIEVFLNEYRAGHLLNSIRLDTAYVIRDSGTFYYPKQIVYKTTQALNENSMYNVYIHNKVSGKIITSDSIPLILGTGFKLQKPFGSNIDFTTVPPYESKMVFQTPKYGKRFQIVFRFHYLETIISTSTTTEKYVDWNLGEQKSSGLAGDETIELSYGEQFFNVVRGAVHPNSDVRRQADKLEVIVYVAGDDLSVYMDVNSPSSSIVQERPEYTNIHNGIGIFSCRFDLRKKFNLYTRSLDSLTYGRYTHDLGFVR